MNSTIIPSFLSGFLFSALITLIIIYIIQNRKKIINMLDQDLLNTLRQLTIDINTAKPLLDAEIAAETASLTPLQNEVVRLENLLSQQQADLQVQIDNINNNLQPQINLTAAQLGLARQALTNASTALDIFTEVKLDADNQFEFMDEAIVILEGRV